MKKVTLFVRLTMITMLSLFFGFQNEAQLVVDIGTYYTTASYIPFYSYYNYSFSECIYKTTDFGDTNPKLITKIGY